MTDIKGLNKISGDVSFKAHYDELNEAASNFREAIQDLLGISRSSFFNKIKNGSWTDLEKRMISIHLDQPITVLFPVNSESHV